MSLCKRIIACVLIENGLVVRRVGFKTKAIIGKPAMTIKYLQKWAVDEIIFINVGAKSDMSKILDTATKKLFLPISVGGSISTIDEIDRYMRMGADKVVIGKHANEKFMTEIVNKYGDQAVSLSVDNNHDNVPEFPCGEIIMHDIERDGYGKGLNLDILKKRVYKNGKYIHKPILAMGGIGSYEDIVEGLKYCDGVCVGNLFHYKEISARKAKEAAKSKGYDMRV